MKNEYSRDIAITDVEPYTAIANAIIQVVSHMKILWSLNAFFVLIGIKYLHLWMENV